MNEKEVNDAVVGAFISGLITMLPYCKKTKTCNDCKFFGICYILCDGNPEVLLTKLQDLLIDKL